MDTSAELPVLSSSPAYSNRTEAIPRSPSRSAALAQT